MSETQIKIVLEKISSLEKLFLEKFKNNDIQHKNMIKKIESFEKERENFLPKEREQYYMEKCESFEQRLTKNTKNIERMVVGFFISLVGALTAFIKFIVDKIF